MGTETFFLWGPRQAGKSTLLREAYPEALWSDLLRSEEVRRYLQNPERLREELSYRPVSQVVIDEVQEVPQLLERGARADREPPAAPRALRLERA